MTGKRFLKNMRETTPDVFSIIGKFLTFLIETKPIGEKIVTGLLKQEEDKE